MYLSLNEYLNLAERIVCKNKLQNSEDNISYVAHFLMLADYRWKEEVGLTRKQFRGMYAKYAKLSLFRKNRKKSIDYSLDWVYNKGKKDGSDKMIDLIPDEKQKTPESYLSEKELVETINSFSKISEQEKEMLIEFFFTNNSILDIGKKLGMKERSVYSKLKTTLNKVGPILINKHT